MRIRRYPGKAIDASLSLDKSNAMETIYKNNWLNAHETFKSSSTNSVAAPGYETDGSSSRGGDDVVGVSSLGKYQMTLDQIRQLQLQHKDPTVAQAMKDLSGYKPSTLSRKNRRNYPGWDDLLIVDSTTTLPTTVAEQLDQTADETAAYNYAQPLKSAGGRKSAADRQQIPVHTKTSETFNNVQIPISVPSEKNSKLKRSQTLKESSAASFCSTLDIKDIFRRRQKNNNIETSTLKKPKKPSSSSSGSSSGNSSGQSSNKSSADMSNNCDRNSLDLNRMQNAYNASASPPPPPSSSSVQRAKSVRLISAAGWTTTPAQSDELIMVAPQRRREKPPSPPPRRANASLRPRQSPPPPPPPAALSLVGYNNNNNKNKFNTISASGINKVHKRMAVIPIEENNVSPPSIKPILKHVQIVDRSRQTGGETALAAASNVLPPLAIMARRKPASSSSADSDEMFSIPRPRLIVPVHTYARRRRTGNLLNAKNDDDDDGGGGVGCDEVEELNDKGMSLIFVFFLCADSNYYMIK